MIHFLITFEWAENENIHRRCCLPISALNLHVNAIGPGKVLVLLSVGLIEFYRKRFIPICWLKQRSRNPRNVNNGRRSGGKGFWSINIEQKTNTGNIRHKHLIKLFEVSFLLWFFAFLRFDMRSGLQAKKWEKWIEHRHKKRFLFTS